MPLKTKQFFVISLNVAILGITVTALDLKSLDIQIHDWFIVIPSIGYLITILALILLTISFLYWLVDKLLNHALNQILAWIHFLGTLLLPVIFYFMSDLNILFNQPSDQIFIQAVPQLILLILFVALQLLLPINALLTIMRTKTTQNDQ